MNTNKIEIKGEIMEILSAGASVNSISFTMADISIQKAVERFSDAEELALLEGEVVYGIYKNLLFTSATVDAVGNVTLKYTIQSENDIRLKQLETSQAEQDAILAEILFGETEGIAGEDADGNTAANGSTVPENNTTEDSHTVPDTENGLDSAMTEDTENGSESVMTEDTANRSDGDTTADINAVEDSMENAGKEENADE